jgi:hypothetical protein
MGRCEEYRKGIGIIKKLPERLYRDGFPLGDATLEYVTAVGKKHYIDEGESIAVFLDGFRELTVTLSGEDRRFAENQLDEILRAKTKGGVFFALWGLETR